MKFAIAILALAVFIVLMQRRSARQRDALWTAFAERVPGLTFTPDKGLSIRHVASGTVKGHEIEMRGYYGCAGRGQIGLMPNVALQAEVSQTGGKTLTLRRRRLTDRMGGETIEVGDDIMDGKWWLEATPPEFARDVFATRISLRNRIAYLDDVTITLEDGVLRMTKSGPPLTFGYFEILLVFMLDLTAAVKEELAKVGD